MYAGSNRRLRAKEWALRVRGVSLNLRAPMCANTRHEDRAQPIAVLGPWLRL
jgi:hypothetical protein